MSEPILGCCSVCGAIGGVHHPDCWLGDIKTPPPAVYDLAEFERQLEAQMLNYPMGREGKPSFGDILDALKSSRKL